MSALAIGPSPHSPKLRRMAPVRAPAAQPILQTGSAQAAVTTPQALALTIAQANQLARPSQCKTPRTNPSKRLHTYQLPIAQSRLPHPCFQLKGTLRGDISIVEIKGAFLLWFNSPI
jgi:hypothetical protein